jgi:uncharacterized DUF497 family protein
MTVRFEWEANMDRAKIVKRAIGSVERVLLTVHTFREEGFGAIIRIVSARKATAAERKLYEEIK